MVVSVLSDAVQEQAIKNIAVISQNQGLAQAFGGKQQGNWVDASTSAKDGLVRVANRGADVVVLDERIPDMHPLQAIRFLRSKSPNAKIVLIGASEKSNEAFDGKVDGIVVGVKDASVLLAKVNEVLGGVDLGPNRKYATRIAEASAKALASVDSSLYDLSSATEALSKTSMREGTVALFSLKALANGGGVEALDEVAKVLQDRKDDEAMAVAACEALGRIMSRSGKADQGVCEALATIAGERGLKASVRSAAVAALGRSPLPAAERTRLLRTLRVDPGAMGGEGGSN
jgi:DNA-binding NarL/FixJ family response regulator